MAQTGEGLTFYLDRPLDAHPRAFQRFSTIKFSPAIGRRKKLSAFSDPFLVGEKPVEVLEPLLGSCFIPATVT